jgi:hypothetical protein
MPQTRTKIARFLATFASETLAKSLYTISKLLGTFAMAEQNPENSANSNRNRSPSNSPTQPDKSEPHTGREAAAPSFIKRIQIVQGGEEVPPNGGTVHAQNAPM